MKHTQFDLDQLIAHSDQLRQRQHHDWEQFVEATENPRPHFTATQPDRTHLRAFMAHNATGIDRHSQLIRKLQLYFDQHCDDLSLRPESGMIPKGRSAPDHSHNWHGRDDMFEVRAQRKGSPEARELEQLMKQRKQG